MTASAIAAAPGIGCCGGGGRGGGGGRECARHMYEQANRAFEMGAGRVVAHGWTGPALGRDTDRGCTIA